MPFGDYFEADEAGRKGGQAKSPAKAKAAKRNGMKGGRKRERSLTEFILRKRLTREQHKWVHEAFIQLQDNEKDIFLKHFGLVAKDSRRRKSERPVFEPMTKDGIRPANPTKRMQHILRKFRLEARYQLRKLALTQC